VACTDRGGSNAVRGLDSVVVVVVTAAAAAAKNSMAAEFEETEIDRNGTMMRVCVRRKNDRATNGAGRKVADWQ
jgi:hypothetical protein